MGMIAQDVEGSFPELIITDDQGFKHMNYPSFSAVLVEAIKDLKSGFDKEMDDLDEESQSMNERLRSLEE